MAAKRNIKVTKGDSYSHVITLQTLDGAPIDVSGRTYQAMVRKVATQTAPNVTFTCTVTNGPAGEVTIYLTDVQTDTLDHGDYRWDFQEDASGIITTLLSGQFKVVQDVTW